MWTEWKMTDWYFTLTEKKKRFSVTSDFTLVILIYCLVALQHSWESNERGKYKQGTKRFNLAYSEQNCRGFKTREA